MIGDGLTELRSVRLTPPTAQTSGKLKRKTAPFVKVDYGNISGELFSGTTDHIPKADWVALAAGVPGTKLRFNTDSQLWLDSKGSLRYSYVIPSLASIHVRADAPGEILAALGRDIASLSWPDEA
jgi:hypothetical protein